MGPVLVTHVHTRAVLPTPVFNLEVARLHPYPVTPLGLRVHNDCSRRRGRVNKVRPVEGAGPHTGLKRDPKTGKITGYTEFDDAGNPVKRFRGEGSPHGGVHPPLVLEPKPGKGPGAPLNRARPARADEIPGGGQ